MDDFFVEKLCKRARHAQPTLDQPQKDDHDEVEFSFKVNDPVVITPGVASTSLQETDLFACQGNDAENSRESLNCSQNIARSDITDLKMDNQKIVLDLQQSDNTDAMRSMLVLKAIKEEPNIMRKLFGTAGTWFILDVLFYGNTLFEPIVLDAAFGSSENSNSDTITRILKSESDYFLLHAIALPGYFVTIAVLGMKSGCISHTPRHIQIQGFAMMFILYLIIGIMWDSLTQNHAVLIIIYGLTFFFSNYGPNSTTFMLPSLSFSKDCRSTLNGFSAASGKLGALVGSSCFEPLTRIFGNANVMGFCAGLSLVGGVVTYYYVLVDDQNELEQIHDPSNTNCTEVENIRIKNKQRREC